MAETLLHVHTLQATVDLKIMLVKGIPLFQKLQNI